MSFWLSDFKNCYFTVFLLFLVYALNYFEKVEETFKSANKLQEFEQFEEILRTFDISIQPVSSLYKVSFSFIITKEGQF